MQHSAFVPNGERGRRATARLLVDTAAEHGIDPHSIKQSRGRNGWHITEALADVLYDVPEKNASGNRAGKKNKNSEEE